MMGNLEGFILICAGMIIPISIMGYLATWRANKYDKEMAASMPRMAQMA